MIDKHSIKEAWQNYHHLAELAHSPLVDSVLYRDLVWEGDVGANAGIAVRALLGWARAQLAVSSIVSKRENAEILRLRFVEQWTVGEVAAELKLSENSIKSRQKTGWNQTARILQKETAARQGDTERSQSVCETRYGALTAGQQRVVRYLSVFDEPVPSQFLINQTDALHDLIAANLVQTVGERTFILHPRLRDFIKLGETERIEWHTVAGHLYIEREAFLRAARHWQRAGMWVESADLLISHKDALGEYEQGQATSLTDWQQLLQNFAKAVLATDEQWAQINILIGRVGKLTNQSLGLVLGAYRRAQRATKLPATRAEIFYWRGHANQEWNVDDALFELGYCYKIAQMHPDDDGTKFWAIKAALLLAWLHITQHPDAEIAKAWLEKATDALGDKNWYGLRADLHNTWSEFYKYRQQRAEQLSHCREGVVAASHANDPLRLLKMTYQLGVAFFQSGAGYYPQARTALTQCELWADATSNHYMQGQIQNALGGLVFEESADYPRAKTHYHRAYDASSAANNTHSIAAACYNIAEVSVILGEIEQAQRYMTEGLDRANSIRNESLPRAFAYLRRAYPELTTGLHPRQQKAIVFVRKNEQITRREQCELTGMSKEQAGRDLNDLVVREIFCRVGKGRSTAYMLREGVT